MYRMRNYFSAGTVDRIPRLQETSIAGSGKIRFGFHCNFKNFLSLSRFFADSMNSYKRLSLKNDLADKAERLVLAAVTQHGQQEFQLRHRFRMHKA